MSANSFSVKARLRSFRYALNGLRILFREEHNARIHLFAAVVVLSAGLLLRVSMSEWLFLIVAIALVFSMELLNSGLEALCNQVSREQHTLIAKAKDLSAAAVFVSACAAALIGFIIFIPKLLALWSAY